MLPSDYDDVDGQKEINSDNVVMNQGMNYANQVAAAAKGLNPQNLSGITEQGADPNEGS